MKTSTIVLGGALAALAALVTSPALADPAYATRNINVRSGPGLDFSIVDQLVAEEPVDRGNCNSDGTWCYIRHEGENGWVAAVFLTTTPPGRPEPPPIEQPATGEAHTATSQINVRTGPDTSFAVVDRLDQGERVMRGQCSSDGVWCYISHDGADGWVAARFLSPVAAPEPPPSAPSGTARIATSPVNVRTGPGTTFSVVDRLDRDEQVELAHCSADGTWCYVSHDGPDGWVAASFLRLPGSSGPGTQGPGNPGPGTQGPGNTGPGNPPMVTQRIGTAIAGMPVRGTPTLFTSTVGHLDRGDTVEVEECTDDGYWCHVTEAGLDGWVPAAFLQISEIQVPAATNTATVARTTPIRRLPGGQSAILGMLQAGTEVGVNQCGPGGNYCEVSYNQLTGWVEADVLQAPTGAQNPRPSGQQPANSVCFTGFGGVEFCLTQ
ncbi:MAG: SH3 domain-containing protein [Alphaproteobacteria bacterium]|nr:SH3 domain-containing protein [Alphaproteobacteria bacterium]